MQSDDSTITFHEKHFRKFEQTQFTSKINPHKVQESNKRM